jgi:hypothetical protein
LFFKRKTSDLYPTRVRKQQTGGLYSGTGQGAIKDVPRETKERKKALNKRDSEDDKGRE